LRLMRQALSLLSPAQFHYFQNFNDDPEAGHERADRVDRADRHDDAEAEGDRDDRDDPKAGASSKFYATLDQKDGSQAMKPMLSRLVATLGTALCLNNKQQTTNPNYKQQTPNTKTKSATTHHQQYHNHTMLPTSSAADCSSAKAAAFSNWHKLWRLQLGKLCRDRNSASPVAIAPQQTLWRLQLGKRRGDRNSANPVAIARRQTNPNSAAVVLVAPRFAPRAASCLLSTSTADPGLPPDPSWSSRSSSAGVRGQRSSVRRTRG
jgi:hypothetical protein